MDTLSLQEHLEQLDELITILEREEDRFFVTIELAYQLRDDLRGVIDEEDDFQE